MAKSSIWRQELANISHLIPQIKRKQHRKTISQKALELGQPIDVSIAPPPSKNWPLILANSIRDSKFMSPQVRLTGSTATQYVSTYLYFDKYEVSTIDLNHAIAALSPSELKAVRGYLWNDGGFTQDVETGKWLSIAPPFTDEVELGFRKVLQYLLKHVCIGIAYQANKTISQSPEEPLYGES